MFGVLSTVAVPPPAGFFRSLDDLLAELHQRMEKDGYKIVKSRSHRGRIGGADLPGNEIVRCDLVCDRGGRPYKCTATKHKTSTKKTDCPWKAKAVHRKTAGGWVLTILCDQHNHEPGTPEPPTPSEVSEEEDNGEADEATGPQPDPETSAAIQVAGVSEAVLRLTGDTFAQFKGDYRKMSQPERFGILSQLQLRIAAIYAVQNEDLQRQRRQDALEKRHQQIEQNKALTPLQSLGIQNRPRQPRRSQQASTQNTPQSQAQPEQISQQDRQMAPQRGQYSLPPHRTELQFPVPGFDMDEYQPPHPGPPRRIRGHRPTQTNGTTAQDSD